MQNAKTKVFEALAACLIDNGVDTLFGLMGDANLFLVDNFRQQENARFVPAVHEGSAVLMAQGYAQVSGKVGVATVTHGPAVTNCITALTDAARAKMGIVLMAGDTPGSNPLHLQNTDQRAAATLCGAGFEQLRAPETALEDLARALYLAKTESRPVIFNMPADFMWADIDYKKTIHSVFETPAYAPEGDVLDEAIGMIASAKRPLILAGKGAIHAGDALSRLADRLEAPLATTLKAKGLFHQHPYSIDICGTLSSPAGYEAIDKADCIVAFGASLTEWTSDYGKLFKGKRVVQVDTNAAAVGRTIHPDAALIADARLSADNIVYWLDEAEIAPSGFTRELDSATLRQHETPPSFDKRAANTVPYVETIQWLNEILPTNKILATDGGRFMTEVWCRIDVNRPQDFLDTTNFGSIGLGLQAAIGASAAAPDRPVVVFTGDGGFMMGGLTELNSAVRERLDLIVVICNDAAYGAEHIQLIDKKMDPAASTFNWPSFAGVAKSLGAEGIDLRSARDLAAVEEAIKVRSGPLVIDMHLDPFDVPRMRT
ncbi:acetolactate synthase [Tateyamaria omphalii]|uniref:thiamine pyrophosphate-binding protein n=1 Tax=Tateyamaria omphalii TaxID=299262 RepID=UPI001678305D|nr:thiamine pyrophosphate-binding protein [Tateyamaria omphalii]GGX41484.1 acetolactate synthase [Tateyamaria omphalii]